jgi:hypothetical protein
MISLLKSLSHYTALTALILSLVYGIPVSKFESNPDENGDKIIRNNDSTYDLHTHQIDIPEIGAVELPTRSAKEILRPLVLLPVKQHVQ